jgi:hypothetical protein
VMQAKADRLFMRSGCPGDGHLTEFSEGLWEWWAKKFPKDEAPEVRTIRRYVGRWRKAWQLSAD